MRCFGGRLGAKICIKRNKETGLQPGFCDWQAVGTPHIVLVELLISSGVLHWLAVWKIPVVALGASEEVNKNTNAKLTFPFPPFLVMDHRGTAAI